MQRDVQARLAALKQECRKAGAKVTHQRREVLRAVVKSDVHPDAATVLERVRERVPSVSFDTVYRTLAFLEEHELIRRVHVSSERARFDGELGSHHHFICTACGRISDFESKALEAMDFPDEAAALGTPTWRQLQVFGVCRACGGQAPQDRLSKGGNDGKGK